MKQEQAELQRRAAYAEVAEKEAKAKKLEADAEKIHADAEQVRAEAGAMARGRRRARRGEDRVRAQGRRCRAQGRRGRRCGAGADGRARGKLRDRQTEIDTKAKTDKEIAEINAQAKIDEAKIVQGTRRHPRAQDAAREALSELKKVASRQEQLERSTDKDRTERGAREKAEKETAAAKEKDKKPEQQGPLVVFEKGAFEGLVKGGGGKTVTAKIGGKTVKMRIEPDDAGTK
jgi:hypothetical protein